MKLIISPEDSFKKEEKKDIQKIILFARKLLKKNKIHLPHKIYFFNSFSEFIKKILPEVKNYGFDESISKEIIKCALKNGTYGTIDYKSNSIIEMNFNPFKNGEYSAQDFLRLIIHESLHLHLSKKMKKDINKLKFRFENGKYVGNPEIIRLDEGYAEFMTKKILDKIDIKEIKKIAIPPVYQKGPSYKKEVSNLNIELFDKDFEKLLILNRDIGMKNFENNFDFQNKNKEILKFSTDNLKRIL